MQECFLITICQHNPISPYFEIIDFLLGTEETHESVFLCTSIYRSWFQR